MRVDQGERIYVRGRVYPGLTYTRSLGDKVATYLGVIPEPEFKSYNLSSSLDITLLLGTKIVFESIDIYEIANIIKTFKDDDVQKGVNFILNRVNNEMIKNNNEYDDVALIIYNFMF